MRGTIPERLVRVVFTTFLALPAVAKSSPDAGGLPMADPVAIVKQLHAAKAYSKNLLASGLLAPDVEWWAAGPRDRLPWAGTWRGRDGVARFFEALNSVMEYERFEGEQYLSGGEEVAAIVQAAGHAKPTGRPFESAIVRVYTFSGGRIVRVRNYYDTAAYVDALRTGP